MKLFSKKKSTKSETLKSTETATPQVDGLDKDVTSSLITSPYPSNEGSNGDEANNKSALDDIMDGSDLLKIPLEQLNSKQRR